MAESVATRVPGPPVERREPRAPEFPGCRAVRISRDEIADCERRIEYWDRATETAMVCEPVSLYHEHPARRLGGLVTMIAQTRGSPIDVFGAADLLVRDARGEPQRIMQADETVYLRPRTTRPWGPAIEVGSDVLPDVVLEVDNTTDVRRGKLALYESWGFPEVWVEVPDEPSPSRPSSLRPGLTIHVSGRERLPRGAEQPRVSRLDGGGDSPGAERARSVRCKHGGAAPGRAGAGRGRWHRAG